MKYTFVDFQQYLKENVQNFHQFLTLEAPSISAAGEITATLIKMGEFNLKGNYFAPGAFDDFIKQDATVPMYFQHQNTAYVGQWENFRMEQDGSVLVADGKLFVDLTQDAKDKAALIGAGKINQVSVGGEADPGDVMWVDRIDEKTGRMTYGVVYNKASVGEVSLVLRPGDENAVIHQSMVELFNQSFPQRGSVSIRQILDFEQTAKSSDPDQYPDPDPDSSPDWSFTPDQSSGVGEAFDQALNDSQEL